MVILTSVGHTQQSRSWVLQEASRTVGLFHPFPLLCHECCALLSWFLMSVSSLFPSVLALLCLSRSHAVWFQGSLPGKNISSVLTFVRLVDFGQCTSLKGGGTVEISDLHVCVSLFCHWLSAPMLFCTGVSEIVKDEACLLFNLPSVSESEKLIGSGS